MEEIVDVKALRARFASPMPSTNQDSRSPKSPHPGQTKPFSPITDSSITLSPQRLSPTFPGQSRPSRAVVLPSDNASPQRLSPTFPGQSRPSRAVVLPSDNASPQRLPPTAPGQSRPPRAAVPPTDNSRVRQTGELLQNMMLRHHRLEGPRLSPVLPQTPTGSVGTNAGTGTVGTPDPAANPIRPQPKQRSGDDVAPLRRPLLPHAPRPPKPKRPIEVNLEQYKGFIRRAPSNGATAPTVLRTPSSGTTGSTAPRMPSSGVTGASAPRTPSRGVTGPSTPRTPFVTPIPAAHRVPVPAASGAPRLPQRDIKPGRLPRQMTTVDMDDEDMYDDIDSLEKNDSWSDSGSVSREEDTDDLYEYIDEDQVQQIRAATEKQMEGKLEVNVQKTEVKKLQEQEQREAQENRRREEHLRKNFQFQGEVEVLHTASVRHDWSGSSKLELSVRLGDRVDIIRVKNNPGGQWLARSSSGKYGYISNTCVDIDYDAIKRQATQIRRRVWDVGELPPPPPDPPGYNQHTSVPASPDPSGSNEQDSEAPDADYYDDVDTNPGSVWTSLDFPPPPIQLNIDPKIEKDLRKKFKFEGPLKVLHTMMVDPNTVMKKPGAKDLSVAPGDVLDIIQLHNKKALCRNKFGKFGFVNRSLLLPMEGEIYDDVEYPSDVYDNDNVDY